MGAARHNGRPCRAGGAPPRRAHPPRRGWCGPRRARVPPLAGPLRRGRPAVSRRWWYGQRAQSPDPHSRSGRAPWPGGFAGCRPFFRRGRGGGPERGGAAAVAGCRTEEQDPGVGVGAFVGTALVAPGRLRPAERAALRRARRGRAAGRFGRPTGNVRPGGSGARATARRPGSAGPPPDVGGAAGSVAGAGGRPRLEHEPPLVRRRERKMARLVHEAA